MKPSPLQEQDGAWSMRRLLALASFTNAIALSWDKADWRIIAIFTAAPLVLLGLTTINDLRGMVSGTAQGTVQDTAQVQYGGENE